MTARHVRKHPTAARLTAGLGPWLVAFLTALLVVACAGDGTTDRANPARLRSEALTILNSPQELADTATFDLDHFGPWLSRVAIEVPPGRGVEPALALAYGSSGPNGLAGNGWRLTGLSSITAKSAALGVSAGNGTDRYFMDGAELVPCSALNPSTPSCQAGGNHAFLDETFHRVMRTDFGWSIWTPNGTETRYTAAGDGRWLQSEVVDRNGQRATYAYTAVGAEWYPASISYGYDGAGVARFEIVFRTEDRPDALSHASRDGLIETTQRLGWASTTATPGCRART